VEAIHARYLDAFGQLHDLLAGRQES
jgi:hypothetical protein